MTIFKTQGGRRIILEHVVCTGDEPDQARYPGARGYYYMAGTEQGFPLNPEDWYRLVEALDKLHGASTPAGSHDLTNINIWASLIRSEIEHILSSNTPIGMDTRYRLSQALHHAVNIGRESYMIPSQNETAQTEEIAKHLTLTDDFIYEVNTRLGKSIATLEFVLDHDRLTSLSEDVEERIRRIIPWLKQIADLIDAPEDQKESLLVKRDDLMKIYDGIKMADLNLLTAKEYDDWFNAIVKTIGYLQSVLQIKTPLED